MDLRILKLFFQGRGNKEIVDTPAGVLLSCTETVGPPGVNALFIRVKIAECINKATLKSSGKAGSLFIRKACIFAVGIRVLEIDLLMCHIKIATADHRFLLLQFQKISQKILFPFHTVFQTAELALGVGSIYSHKIILIEFQRDDTSFFIMLLYPDPVNCRQWLPLRKNGCT